MKSSSSSRLAPELDARLTSYSTTALAVAAVGTLGATRAAAQITFSSPITSVTTDSGNFDAVNGLSFNVGQQSFHIRFRIDEQQFGGRSVIFDDLPTGGLARVNFGLGEDLVTVPDRDLFPYGQAAKRFATEPGHLYSDGPLKANDIGYIGFRLAANDHTYNGWLRIQMAPDLGSVKVLTKDGVPGVYGAWSMGAIAAGEVVPLTFVAVPEPATVATGLGLLALGAAGVREFRRRRAAA